MPGKIRGSRWSARRVIQARGDLVPCRCNLGCSRVLPRSIASSPRSRENDYRATRIAPHGPPWVCSRVGGVRPTASEPGTGCKHRSTSSTARHLEQTAGQRRGVSLPCTALSRQQDSSGARWQTAGARFCQKIARRQEPEHDGASAIRRHGPVPFHVSLGVPTGDQASVALER